MKKRKIMINVTMLLGLLLSSSCFAITYNHLTIDVLNKTASIAKTDHTSREIHGYFVNPTIEEIQQGINLSANNGSASFDVAPHSWTTYPTDVLLTLKFDQYAGTVNMEFHFVYSGKKKSPTETTFYTGSDNHPSCVATTPQRSPHQGFITIICNPPS